MAPHWHAWPCMLSACKLAVTCEPGPTRPQLTLCVQLQVPIKMPVMARQAPGGLWTAATSGRPCHMQCRNSMRGVWELHGIGGIWCMIAFQIRQLQLPHICLCVHLCIWLPCPMSAMHIRIMWAHHTHHITHEYSVGTIPGSSARCPRVLAMGA